MSPFLQLNTQLILTGVNKHQDKVWWWLITLTLYRWFVLIWSLRRCSKYNPKLTIKLETRIWCWLDFVWIVNWIQKESDSVKKLNVLLTKSVIIYKSKYNNYFNRHFLLCRDWDFIISTLLIFTRYIFCLIKENTCISLEIEFIQQLHLPGTLCIWPFFHN